MELKWHLGDLIEENNEKKKTRAKSKFYLFRLLDTSIGRDLSLYRQQDEALWLGYEKIFPKQNKSQTLTKLYLLRKNQILWYPKPDGLVFAALTLDLDFFDLGPLMLFPHFPCLKTPLDLQIVKFSSCLGPLLNL
jgi:hypothetical protein